MPEARDQPGGGVGERGTGDARIAAVVKPRQQSRERLADIVVGGTTGIGTVGAEAGDEAEDEARIEAAQRRLVDAQAFLHAGPHVDHQRVGPRDQRMQELEATRRGVVEREAALVAVVRLKVRARQPAGEPAERIAALRALDLDDVGAELGEQHRGIGRGDECAEIEHLEPGQHPHVRPPPVRLLLGLDARELDDLGPAARVLGDQLGERLRTVAGRLQSLRQHTLFLELADRE